MTKQQINSVSEAILIIKELQKICKEQREENRRLKQEIFTYNARLQCEKERKDFMKHFKSKMKGKIFNAQEVQNIISGNKTMFREVIKPQTYGEHAPSFQKYSDVFCFKILGMIETIKCPYQIGQKIFCKENYEEWDDGLVYKADNLPANIVSKWKPAQHMKQEHSRLTLLIKEIRVERLAEISEADAIKEGATSRPNCDGYANKYDGWCMDWSKVGEASRWATNGKTLSESDICMGSAQYAFAHYWNATHKKPEEKWEANPFVFVYQFELIK